MGRTLIASVKPITPLFLADGGLLTADERRRLHEYVHTNPYAFQLRRAEDVDNMNCEMTIRQIKKWLCGNDGRTGFTPPTVAIYLRLVVYVARNPAVTEKRGLHDRGNAGYP